MTSAKQPLTASDQMRVLLDIMEQNVTEKDDVELANGLVKLQNTLNLNLKNHNYSVDIPSHLYKRLIERHVTLQQFQQAFVKFIMQVIKWSPEKRKHFMNAEVAINDKATGLYIPVLFETINGVTKIVTKTAFYETLTQQFAKNGVEIIYV